MCVMNITDEYNDFINCTDNENKINIIVPTMLLTIPCRLSIFCLIILMIHTIFMFILLTNE